MRDLPTNIEYRHNIVKLVCDTVMMKFVIIYSADASKANGGIYHR